MVNASPSFHFVGFEQANTTPIPDVLFDVLLPHLGYAELKVLLYIIRRTRGFKKDTDPISFNQFLRGITTRDGKVLDHGCGIKDRSSLSLALKSLEKKGVIKSSKGIDERGENETTIYSIRWKEEEKAGGNPHEEVPQKGERDYTESPGGVVGQPDYPSRATRLPVVGQPDQQETVLQQTDLHYRNISKSNALDQKEKTDVGAVTKSGNQTLPETFSQSDHASGKKRAASKQFIPLGDLLPQRSLTSDRRSNSPRIKPTPAIVTAVSDISQKLRDSVHISANVSQAMHIFSQWGKGRSCL